MIFKAESLFVHLTSGTVFLTNCAVPWIVDRHRCYGAPAHGIMLLLPGTAGYDTPGYTAAVIMHRLVALEPRVGLPHRHSAIGQGARCSCLFICSSWTWEPYNKSLASEQAAPVGCERLSMSCRTANMEQAAQVQSGVIQTAARPTQHANVQFNRVLRRTLQLNLSTVSMYSHHSLARFAPAPRGVT